MAWWSFQSSDSDPRWAGNELPRVRSVIGALLSLRMFLPSSRSSNWSSLHSICDVCLSWWSQRGGAGGPRGLCVCVCGRRCLQRWLISTSRWTQTHRIGRKTNSLSQLEALWAPCGLHGNAWKVSPWYQRATSDPSLPLREEAPLPVPVLLPAATFLPLFKEEVMSLCCLLTCSGSRLGLPTSPIMPFSTPTQSPVFADSSLLAINQCLHSDLRSAEVSTEARVSPQRPQQAFISWRFT